MRSTEARESAPGGDGPPAPARPALRYYGGKWRLAPWVLRHLPPHRCYVEPFAGGASVLLRKPPAPLEVLNDLNGDVVAFWRALRDRPAELIRAIELTPFARAELELAGAAATGSGADDVERARRFFVLSWQGIHGAPAHGAASGWRLMRTREARGGVPVEEWGRTGHLWRVAARLKGVQLECRPALEVLRRFDTPQTLFFCDPPYLAATRSARWRRAGYGATEMDEAAHRELAGVLRAVRGPVVLCGYPSALYDGLYAGWRRVTTTARTQTTGVARECLWLSPQAVERLATHQLPLLEEPR